MRSFLAVLVAGFASSLYVLSTVLQALEARKAPPRLALQADLLASLVRRRIWLAGTVTGLIAWPLQAVALALASVALVQPALGLGLVVLLAVGHRLLGERVGRREIIGVITIGSGLALVGGFVPSHTGVFTRRGSEILIGLLIVIAGAPYLLRVLGRAGGFATSLLAGLGWAWVGLGTALVDGAIGDRHWFAVIAWGACVGLASWAALLTEMTALQTWPATRVIPLAFALEMAAPAAAVPAFTRQGAGPWHGIPLTLALGITCAGAALLGSSPSIERTFRPDRP